MREMARLSLLLCCCLCVVPVHSFLPGPWTVIVFDDVGGNSARNYYTPFMEPRSRDTVDNRMRRPPTQVVNRRPLPGRIPPNNLYPPRREVVAPSNTVKYISPYVSSPYCPVGQQYVYLSPGLERGTVASVCPLENPNHRFCRCRTGCRHKNFFIPYGTSITVDKCGNKCYCNNQNGEVECEYDSC